MNAWIILNKKYFISRFNKEGAQVWGWKGGGDAVFVVLRAWALSFLSWITRWSMIERGGSMSFSAIKMQKGMKKSVGVIQLLVDVWWHLPSTCGDCAGGHETGSYPLLAVSPVFLHHLLPATTAWCRCWRIHLSFSRKMFIGGLSWQTSPGMWSNW